MSATTIEWTDRTWNPVTGCDKVSPGCAHCYAEGVADRFWATQYPAIATGEGLHHDGERPRRFTDVFTHAERLREPLSWRKPARVFVNSMSDLFHEDVPDVFIGRVFDVMASAPRHTFQLLTKRPDRMRVLVPTFAERHTAEDGTGWPLSNVWLGVSVENQHFADERIPLLLQTPAALRFISAEPLLGPIDIRSFMPNALWNNLPSWKEPELNWVIVGGESGPKARRFDLEWGRRIVMDCRAAGVPVFVKQLGSAPDGWYTNALGPRVNRHTQRDRKGGDMAEWPEDLRVREFPT